MAIERGPVLEFELDRPKQRNALTDPMVAALIDALDAAGPRRGGAGHRGARRRRPLLRRRRHRGPQRRRPAAPGGQHPAPPAHRAHRLIPLLLTMQVPVVCRVQGWAAGIGFQLALASDFTVVADDGAPVGALHRAGLHPRQRRHLAAARGWSARSGPASCSCSARAVSGAEAADWGLVHRAVPGRRPRRRRSTRWPSGSRPDPTVALGLTKWLLHAGAAPPLDAQLQNEALALELSSRSEDFREGLAAFVEKRPPIRRTMTVGGRSHGAGGRLAMGPDTPVDDVLAHGARPGSTSTCPPAWRGGGPTRRPGRGAHGADQGRLRGLVPGVRRVRPGRADLAGGVRRPGPGPGAWPGASKTELRPFNLGRLNPLGLNLAAPALFAHGTEEQRLRFLPPIVRNEERWCQLFSEPGAGLRPGLAGHPGRARRRRVGAHRPEGLDHLGPPVGLRRAAGPHRPRRAQARGHHLLPDRPAPAGRRGPAAAPHDRRGRLQRGVPRRRPGPRRPAGRARWATGWRVANATLSGERQMVSGAGLGRRRPHRRIGRRSPGRAWPGGSAPRGGPGGWDDPVRRQAVDAAVVARSGSGPGPTSGSGRSCGPGAPRARRARSARSTRASSTSASSCWPPTCSAPAATGLGARRPAAA